MHARDFRKVSPGDHRYSSGDGMIAGLYDLDRTIGKGHFAVVKLARHVFTGEQVAVKVIDKTKLDEVSKSHLFQEVRCMKLVQHPNVVRLYEVIDTATKLYLILELGDGGDMYDYIMKHERGLREDVARNYFRQIVTAIHYCHQLHVVHRDLKPENVVFFETAGQVKLTDFGFSNKFVPGRKLDTSCGSLAYSAPEILLGDAYDAPAVDVWSLGVILYMLVAGVPPFQEANDSETLTMIMDCKYRRPAHVSDLCLSLVAKLLVREPEERITLEDILCDPWLQLAPHESPPAPARPLISREHISDEHHQSILQKMVEGKIASKDEILSAVEGDYYNHITATYYLLAERRLRKQHDIAAQQQLLSEYRMNPGRHENVSEAKPRLASLSLSPRTQSADASDAAVRRMRELESLVSPPGVHPSTRPVESPVQSYIPHSCSLIREEGSGDETEGDFRRRRSRDEEDLPPGAAEGRHPAPLGAHRKTAVRPLHSVRSSPQLLNEVLEEVTGESEEEDDFVQNKFPAPSARKMAASPDLLRKYDRGRKKSKGNKSCSSSDTSDNETETDKKMRREKLKQRLQRRDSSDHSSDTDAGPGSAPSGGGGRRFGRGGDHHGGQGDRGRHDDGRDKENKNGTGGGRTGNTRSVPNHTRLNGALLNNINAKEELLSNGVAASPPLQGTPAKQSKQQTPAEEDTSHMIKNMSLASKNFVSGLSNKANKYIVREEPRRAHARPGHNVEDDAGRMIHVRSRDFSTLVNKFKVQDDHNTSGGSGTKTKPKHKRKKDRLKVDLNRNGLIASTNCIPESDDVITTSGDLSLINTSKCCSVI